MATEAHKTLEMVLEELNLMESEAGAVNKIIQCVVEMVAEMTKD